jgi:hypothetical protein
MAMIFVSPDKRVIRSLIAPRGRRIAERSSGSWGTRNMTYRMDLKAYVADGFRRLLKLEFEVMGGNLLLEIKVYESGFGRERIKLGKIT